ncbi:MAG: hypothetical protein IPF87_04745 [Gemmatimonadetes bacterium]|nr:hypothetical protein [Gemmatimonadota bacterium]MBK7835245.1 hypothetical protein [Gemmatimonadota bacterium]
MPTAHATRPPRREPKPWSFRDLKARCRRLRDQLSIAATDVITPEELAAYWPGGGENAQEGIGAWIFCYAQMVRLADRMREPTPAQRQGTLYRSEVALTDATLDRAETVPLEAGEIVAVHPLSYEALELCATLNQVILFATEVAGQFAHQESAASEELRAFQPLVRSTAVRLWAWVITAGPALPFPVSADWPEPPEWTAAITPLDLLALAGAHRRVNSERTALVAQLMPDDHTTSQRLSLSAFVGAYAHEHGGDAAAYMRRFALGKLFAQAVSAARSIEASRKKASPPTSEG